jgi:hypothetical protein
VSFTDKSLPAVAHKSGREIARLFAFSGFFARSCESFFRD